MKRRGFLGSLLGSTSLAVVSPIATADTQKPNPLSGNKPFVRVFKPVKTGDRLVCSKALDDLPHAWVVGGNEKAHCVALMDATFKFSNPHVDENGELSSVEEKGSPYSQVIVVDVI